MSDSIMNVFIPYVTKNKHTSEKKNMYSPFNFRGMEISC